jgi:hypothetical protein
MVPEARKRWISFHNHVEGHLKEEGGDLWPIRGFANKMPEHAARLAAALTLVTNLDAGAIDDASMERGVRLAEHYACEALRLFEAALANPDLVMAQRLLDWLRQWPEAAISLREIYRVGPNSIRDKATASKMAAILEAHGWLEPIPGGAIVADRRCRQAWRIVKGG